MTAVRGPVGVIAVGRPTFDTDLGAAQARTAIELLETAGLDLFGGPDPVLEPDDVAVALSSWPTVPEFVIVLQATFTDSRFLEEVLAASDGDVAIWAFPERRGGGRLLLNSLCGMILASFAAALGDRPIHHLYLDPQEAGSLERVRAWIDEAPIVRPLISPPMTGEVAASAKDVVNRLGRCRIGIVGDPPPGFGPCGVQRDAGVAVQRSGVDFESRPIGAVLARAVEAAHDASAVESTLPGADALESDAVARAGGLRVALSEEAEARTWDALAVRCWPETFDQLGCAACSALAGLNEAGVPAGCEADAFGALTMLILGWLGDSRPFLADLVDVDVEGDTAALWHCGVAPSDIAAPGSLHAGVHPNRHVPLVQMAALRPGTATMARLSQSRGVARMVVGRVEVLDAPCPYEGSGGVVRFERPVAEVLDTVLAEGLEHHLALVYGDVVDDLRGVAIEMGLPVVEL